jgi:hypothetical protein
VATGEDAAKTWKEEAEDEAVVVVEVMMVDGVVLADSALAGGRMEEAALGGRLGAALRTLDGAGGELNDRVNVSAGSVEDGVEEEEKDDADDGDSDE